MLRATKNMDSDFNRESFERELREYIMPEVVDTSECGSGVVWRSCKRPCLISLADNGG